MEKRNIYSQLLFPFLLEILSITIFALTVWIARTTLTMQMSILGLTINSSSILTLLSISQAIQSVLITTILFSLFEALNWTLIGRETGLSSISAIGLSPTTGVIGAIKIIFSRCSQFPDRVWPLLRLVLMIILWVSGIILFADTSVGVAYKPVFDYRVAAGVGRFNGSYVHSYIQLLQDREAGYPYAIVPYTVQAMVNNLVTTPMHTVAGKPVPVAACADNDCESYLLPGGLMTTTPWPPTNYSSAPVVQINNAPTVQLDFASGLSGHSFSEDDCTVYGNSTTYVGINVCLGASRTFNGSFAAGLYVCPDGAYDGTCRLGNNLFYPNLTTTFSVFNRKTTFIAARSNLSILSTTSSGSPVQNPTLDIENFRAALTWLLDFNASNIPAPTSIAEQFFSGQEQLKDPYWYASLAQTFHSILALPFWFFNPNNPGNIWNPGRELNGNLPPEFYTTASVATQHYTIIINTAMFLIFVALHSLLHISICAVFAWLCIKRPSLPVISSYPIFDFAFKTMYQRKTSAGNKRDPIYQLVRQNFPSAGIWMVNDGETLSALKPCTHFLRTGNDAFSLTADQGTSHPQPVQQTSINGFSPVLSG
ncbi:hypothetical protein BDV06DRAFT_197802 [Aspergillus oleicola]